MPSNPFSPSASMTSCATLVSVAGDKEEEGEEEEWMALMFVSPFVPFDSSNLRIKKEKTNSVPKKRLSVERSYLVET